ncbi:MAG: sulfatase [Acidobacteriota bacterium]|jgi:arylsulfatase A-like enzyme
MTAGIGRVPLLMAATVAACGPGPRAEAPAPAENVILVSIDTLRADRLGCYGRVPSFTPNIDAFREDAVLFELTIAQAPSTLSSHASLFTSLLPQHHGASIERRRSLAADHLTVAEVLRAEGFKTAAFHGGGQLDAVFGVGQGFDVWETPGHRPGEAFKDEFQPTVAAALSWLEQVGQDPFLLFVHTYENHHPYTPSPENLAAVEADYEGPLPSEISIELLNAINTKRSTITPEDLRHIESTYEAEIRSVDAAFGALVEGLRRLDLYERSLVIFTSDHGEEFGEHGMVGWHGHTLYDELLRVPLLIKYRDSWHAGQTLSEQVRLLDVAPTMLSALDRERPAVFEGANLTLYAAGGAAPAPYAVSVLEEGGTSIRTPKWKRIRRSLFDLSHDPGETEDVAEKFPGTSEKLRLIRLELITESPSIGAVDAPISPELRERLESLGYVE